MTVMDSRMTPAHVSALNQAFCAALETDLRGMISPTQYGDIECLATRSGMRVAELFVEVCGRPDGLCDRLALPVDLFTANEASFVIAVSRQPEQPGTAVAVRSAVHDLVRAANVN